MKKFVVVLSFTFFTSSLAFTSQGTQFRTGIDLVEVDVTVIDKNGRPITDLTARDFEIRERGATQRIDTIYLVTGDPALLRQTPQPSDAAAPDAGAPVPRRAPQPRVFVFVLDIAHLSPGGFDRTRTAIRSFLNEGLRPLDLAGLVVNGEMLGNRIVSDKAVLLALLEGVATPSGARYNDMRTWPRILTEEEAARIARNDDTARNQAIQRACDERPGDCTGNGRFAVEAEIEAKSRLIAGESVRDAQTTLGTLLTLANGLGRFPGPKSVAVFSEGFYTGDFSERVSQVAGLAARNRVRISTLDARGLARDLRQQSLLGEAPVVGTSDFGTVLGFDENADVLTTLALDTGGQRVRDRNNLRPALDAIALETGTYYMLGYSPRDAFDGSYRKIDVSVKRPGLTVRARRGYLAVKPMPPAAGPGAGNPPAAPAPAPATSPVTAAAPPVPAPSAATLPAPATPASAASPSAAVPDPASAAAPGAAPLRVRPDGTSNTDAVTRRLAEAASSKTDPAAAIAREGWDLYSAGKVEEARDKLAAAATGGGGVWVDYALGLAEFALRHADAAAAAWQRVRSAQPDFEAVYFDLADAYLQLGRGGDALAVLRDAARRWPTDAEAHNAVGVVLVARGALDDAVDAFSRAVSAAPGEGLGHFNLARAYHLRYLRMLKTAGQASTQAVRSLADRDRQRAVEAYKKCLAIGGPFEKDARDAIGVLEWR